MRFYFTRFVTRRIKEKIMFSTLPIFFFICNLYKIWVMYKVLCYAMQLFLFVRRCELRLTPCFLAFFFFLEDDIHLEIHLHIVDKSRVQLKRKSLPLFIA